MPAEDLSAVFFVVELQKRPGPLSLSDLIASPLFELQESSATRIYGEQVEEWQKLISEWQM